jgi:hypothetical protein
MKKSFLNLMILVAVFVCISLTCVSITSADFETSDLGGVWNFHAITSGLTEVWVRMDATFTSNGDMALNGTASDGSQDTSAATFEVTNLGIVRPVNVGETSFEGIMHLGKNMIVYTDIFDNYSSEGGTNQIGIGLRTGGTFSQSDLLGTWRIHTLSTGLSEIWQRVTATVDAEGNLTGSVVDSEGFESQGESTIILEEDGSIQVVEDSTVAGRMNLEKNLFVITNDLDEGSINALSIGVKAGGTYTQSDLQGTWKIHRLTAGLDDDNAWQRVTVRIDANGDFTFDSFDSEGYTESGTGRLLISDDGTIQTPGTTALNWEGFMNLEKNTIVVTETEDDGSVGLSIGTKMISFDTDDSGSSGGGGGGGGCFIMSVFK